MDLLNIQNMVLKNLIIFVIKYENKMVEYYLLIMDIYLKNAILILQSVYKHKFNDLSKNIGNADITSLVNFSLYKKYFI